MLQGINPVVSPDLLYILAIMGHGDELVLADAHFPGHSLGERVIRADGIMIADLLRGIVPLFPLDNYVTSPLTMMAAAGSDQLDPGVEKDYEEVFRKFGVMPSTGFARIHREGFYDRARNAFAVVMTGELRKYGNLALKKGVCDT